MRRMVFYRMAASIVLAVAASLWVAYDYKYRAKIVGTEEMSPVDHIDVILIVEEIGDSLAVRSRFENISNSKIHVRRGSFGYGDPTKTLKRPQEVYEDQYTIRRMDGSFLPYIGKHVYFMPSGSVEDDFSIMNPGQVVSSRWDRIDTAYDFDEGTHSYEIIHIHNQLNEATGDISEHRSRSTKFVYTKVADHRRMATDTSKRPPG